MYIIRTLVVYELISDITNVLCQLLLHDTGKMTHIISCGYRTQTEQALNSLLYMNIHLILENKFYFQVNNNTCFHIYMII